MSRKNFQLSSKPKLFSQFENNHLFKSDLEKVDFSYQKIESLPIWFHYSFDLATHVNLSNNFLLEIPEALYYMHELKELIIDYNEVKQIERDFFANLPNLELFSAVHNEIRAIIVDLHKPLSKLKSIHLSHNHLEVLPQIFHIIFPSLVYLYLDHNQLTVLPPQIEQISSLQVIDVSYNNLETIPPLSRLTNLKEFNIEGNHIYQPKSIQKITSLGFKVTSQRRLLSPKTEKYHTTTLRSGKRKIASPTSVISLRKRQKRKETADLALNYNTMPNDLKIGVLLPENFTQNGIDFTFTKSQLDAQNKLEMSQYRTGCLSPLPHFDTNIIICEAKDQFGNKATIHIFTKGNKKMIELGDFCFGSQIVRSDIFQAKKPEIIVFLKGILDTFSAYIAWTYVEAEENWLILLECILKAGFSNPYITNVTSQHQPIKPNTDLQIDVQNSRSGSDSDRVLGFYNTIVYGQSYQKEIKQATLLMQQILHSETKSDNEEKEKEEDTEPINQRLLNSNVSGSAAFSTLTRSKSVYSNLSEHVGKCQYTLSSKAIKMLYGFLNSTVEVGGYLQPTNKGKLEIGEIIEGAEDYTVDLGEDYPHPLVYHTHPHICYEKLGCVVAWPSPSDMAMTFIYCMKQKHFKAHIVATQEGIYVVSLLPWLNNIKRSLTNRCKGTIGRIIVDYFYGDEEIGQFVRHQNKSTEILLANYLERVPQFTVNEILQYAKIDPSQIQYVFDTQQLKCLENKAFRQYATQPLFQVQLFGWEQIDKSLEFEIDC